MTLPLRNMIAHYLGRRNGKAVYGAGCCTFFNGVPSTPSGGTITDGCCGFALLKTLKHSITLTPPFFYAPDLYFSGEFTWVNAATGYTASYAMPDGQTLTLQFKCVKVADGPPITYSYHVILSIGSATLDTNFGVGNPGHYGPCSGVRQQTNIAISGVTFNYTLNGQAVSSTLTITITA